MKIRGYNFRCNSLFFHLKIDIGYFRLKMTNQIDDKDDDLLTNVVEPDENEWKKFFDE
jgi:hypothetical protein